MLEDKKNDLQKENENVEDVAVEDLDIFGCDCSSCPHNCGENDVKE